MRISSGTSMEWLLVRPLFPGQIGILATTRFLANALCWQGNVSANRSRCTSKAKKQS